MTTIRGMPSGGTEGGGRRHVVFILLPAGASWLAGSGMGREGYGFVRRGQFVSGASPGLLRERVQVNT